MLQNQFKNIYFDYILKNVYLLLDQKFKFKLKEQTEKFIQKFRMLQNTIDQKEYQDNQFLISFSKSNHASQPIQNKLRALPKKLNFIEDNDQNKKQNILFTESKAFSNSQKPKNKNSKNTFTKHEKEEFGKDSYSPQIISLLQNCKVSIESLKSQLAFKNEQISKLEQENKKLNLQLLQSQTQVQRTHQILAIYIRQSQTKQKRQELINYGKIQQEKNLILNKYMQQNSLLQEQNINLKNDVQIKNAQINYLEQKISQMKKGLGKALSTIKKQNQKTNLKFNPQTQIFQTKNTSNLRDQINGKIITKNIQPFPSRKITFQTPIKKQSKEKNTISNQISTIESFVFTQKCQQKMKQISTNAKKYDQIDKIEGLLHRMKQLTRFQDSQMSDFQ